MEEELIKKIKSKFILNHLFNYIKGNNFKLKLFIYSKSIQNKLDLNIIYIELYLKKIGFNLDNYLYIKSTNKDILNNSYQKFLSENKFNKVKFENILYEILKKKENEYINDDNKNEYNDKIIDINSPLFELISKTKNFEQYTIYIFQKNNAKINDEYK